MTSQEFYVGLEVSLGWDSNPMLFVAVNGVLVWDSNPEPSTKFKNLDKK